MISMMNRLEKIEEIRNKLNSNEVSIGSWMQIPSSTVAEIMGNSGYDWVAIDMEHGSINVAQLPDIFRALELGNTLPLVRLTEGTSKQAKQALDAGAGGIIIPMLESAEHLEFMINSSKWPPIGKRGVGFSRANLFGEFFDNYVKEAHNPLIVAMIENISALDNLESILKVKGLDAILIGPYDLSASIGHTGKFQHPVFIEAIERISLLSRKHSVAFGIHVVEPELTNLDAKIKEHYQFIAYSIDSVFLLKGSKNPLN